MRNGKWFALLAAGGATVGYAARRQLFARRYGLTPPTHRVRVQTGLRIEMEDGIGLAADHYAPEATEPLPTILIRTPYSRGGLFGRLMVHFAHRFAERGYHVVVQDVRGRFDSEGTFEPYVAEAADGRDTIAWIARQPWSDGQVAMWGPSYVGYVQWAAAASVRATPEPALKAIVPMITESNIGGIPDHSFNLDTALRWMVVLDAMENGDHGWVERLRRLRDARRQNAVMAPALTTLPLNRSDYHLFERPVAFFQRWQAHPEPDDPYWVAVDFRDTVADAPPSYFIATWPDLFISGQLDDYLAQRAAGRSPYLTIGPWIHIATETMSRTLAETLAWLDAELKGDRSRLREKPVRLYVMGANEWREYDAWPPSADETPYYLSGAGPINAGRLQNVPPPASEAPDRYTYDPHRPTPAIGGALLSAEAGPVDNRPLEIRGDVLVYSTPPLATPLEVIGTPRVELFVQTTAASADFFARLAVVNGNGRSHNISDGIFTVRPERVAAAGGAPIRIAFDLTPIAYRLAPGQRIRLLVASGAHPRFARNPGSGESLFTTEKLVTAEQTVFHDADHPSAVYLPLHGA